MIMERKRKAKVMVASPGGTASKTSKTYRITLPNNWVRDMGITEDDRDVNISFTDDKKILIEKFIEEL